MSFNTFPDLRLYRENSVKKPNRKDWECVCLTLSDWHTFLKQFRKTTNSHERELYSYVNDELFPLIESQLKVGLWLYFPVSFEPQTHCFRLNSEVFF